MLSGVMESRTCVRTPLIETSLPHDEGTLSSIISRVAHLSHYRNGNYVHFEKHDVIEGAYRNRKDVTQGGRGSKQQNGSRRAAGPEDAHPPAPLPSSYAHRPQHRDQKNTGSW